MLTAIPSPVEFIAFLSASTTLIYALIATALVYSANRPRR